MHTKPNPPQAQALLRRFQSLFSMPSRVRALSAAHDYEQVGGLGGGWVGCAGVGEGSVIVNLALLLLRDPNPCWLYYRSQTPITPTSSPHPHSHPIHTTPPKPNPPTQVCAEFKKANALIRPSSTHNTGQVWARLHTEIEKRVSEVWAQLELELQHPELPAATAPDLLLHMMALQAEGLPVAQVGWVGVWVLGGGVLSAGAGGWALGVGFGVGGDCYVVLVFLLPTLPCCVLTLTNPLPCTPPSATPPPLPSHNRARTQWACCSAHWSSASAPRWPPPPTSTTAPCSGCGSATARRRRLAAAPRWTQRASRSTSC